MAATKKNIAIQVEKEALRAEAENIIAEARAATKKFPPAVIAGDARLACAWRDAAEGALYVETIPPLSITLKNMNDRVGGLKKLLNVIKNPTKFLGV